MDEDIIKKVEELSKKMPLTPLQQQDEERYLDMMETLVTPLNITLSQMHILEPKLKDVALTNIIFGLVMTHSDTIDEALTHLENVRKVVIHIDKKTNQRAIRMVLIVSVTVLLIVLAHIFSIAYKPYSIA